MFKKVAVAVLCVTGSLYADTTTVSIDSGSVAVFDQNVSQMNLLTGGSSTDGNGAVLQLGYFSAATVANNFAGTWIPLTGQMSLNTAIIAGSNSNETYNQSSIGDLNGNGGGNGTFFITFDFTAGDALSGNSLPSSATIPLAIRFYNGTTIGNSTFFNTVSDDLWTWKNPSTPPSNVALSLDDPNLEWQSIVVNGQAANTAFHTTISAIPEPTTITSLLLGASMLSLVVIRKRR